MSYKAGLGGVENFKKRLEAVKVSLIDEEALTTVSKAAKEIILKRTSDGVSIEGSTFAPYSSSYKIVREKKGMPSDKVDLRRTGEMLDDLAVEVNAGIMQSEIFFETDESIEKARTHQVFGAGRNNVRRRFFGLSEEEKSGLTAFYWSHIERVLLENR